MWKLLFILAFVVVVSSSQTLRERRAARRARVAAPAPTPQQPTPQQPAPQQPSVVRSDCPQGEFQAEILRAHDRVRASVDERPLQPLPKAVWSDELARDAQKFVDVCPISHVHMLLDGRPGEYVTQTGNTENIFYTSNSAPPGLCPAELAARAVQNWEAEKAAWQFRSVNPLARDPHHIVGCKPTQQISTCNHYIAMIMAENFEVGCAYNTNCLACNPQWEAGRCEKSRQCPKRLELRSSMTMQEKVDAHDRYLRTDYSDCTKTRSRVQGEYGASVVVCRYRVPVMPIRGRSDKEYSVLLPYVPATPFLTVNDVRDRRPSGRLVGRPLVHERRWAGDQYVSQDTRFAYRIEPEGLFVAVKPHHPTMCHAVKEFVAANPSVQPSASVQGRNGFNSATHMLMSWLCGQNIANIPAGDLATLCPANVPCQ